MYCSTSIKLDFSRVVNRAFLSSREPFLTFPSATLSSQQQQTMFGLANALLGVSKSSGTDVSKKRKAETIDDGLVSSDIQDNAAMVAKVCDEKHSVGVGSSTENNNDAQDAVSQTNIEKRGENELTSKSKEKDELEGAKGDLTKAEPVSAKEENDEQQENVHHETKEDEEEEDDFAESLKDNPYDRLRYCIVENDGKPESCVKLIGLKSLFSKQLPKMPRTYIARLVFDRRHKSLAILSDDPQHKGADEEIIGAICYRGFYEMRFAEIAFCAVNSSHQVKVRHSKNTHNSTSLRPPIGRINVSHALAILCRATVRS